MLSLPSREVLIQSIPAELPAIIPLTTNESSWVLHLSSFAKSPSRQVFSDMFQKHPSEQHAHQLYGKRVLENRYSQMYSVHADSTYKYSGATRTCQVCSSEKPEERWILDLCQVSNRIYEKLQENGRIPPQSDYFRETEQIYDCCLVNWYQPQHHIGLHADDERELNPNAPIVSLSWGGPRRFLLRPKLGTSNLHPKQFPSLSPTTAKDKKSPCFEIMLRDGDLLLMGGKCQQEFKHEIPKIRKKDGVVGPRISWTVRSMLPQRKLVRCAGNHNLGDQEQSPPLDGKKRRIEDHMNQKELPIKVRRDV